MHISDISCNFPFLKLEKVINSLKKKSDCKVIVNVKTCFVNRTKPKRVQIILFPLLELRVNTCNSCQVKNKNYLHNS